MDTIDANVMTPLHHALLKDPTPLESGCFLTAFRIDIEGEFGPGPDEIFETVKVLVDSEQTNTLRVSRGLVESLSQPMNVEQIIRMIE